MYRTVQQIESAMSFLATFFPQYFTRTTLPHASREGRAISALRMRSGSGPERRGVLLVGGTHARELMNPDAMIELAVALLLSHQNGTDLRLGRCTFTAMDVRVILSALDLWFIPCLNPDGRIFVQTVDDMWRKNRRNNPRTTCKGVDLNRNYDFVWGVTQGQTSCSACAEVFCGPSAFSEPETKNVKWLLDNHRICCFADVHSYSELVLYPWGHAPNQTSNPSQRFTGLATGTCAGIPQAGYQEYIDPRDLLRFQTVGQRIADRVHEVRGRVYTSQPSMGLYATTGTASDYVYSRHIANPRLGKTYAYTFETGPWTGDGATSFHPANPDPIKDDAKAAMLTLAQQCICAIELIGSRFLGRDAEVMALRDVRDKLLATTSSGRQWINRFETVQHRLLSRILADEALAKKAAALLERVGELAADSEKEVSKTDVAEARALMKALARDETDKAVLADFALVEQELERAGGRSARKAIESLMGPDKIARRTH